MRYITIFVLSMVLTGCSQGGYSKNEDDIAVVFSEKDQQIDFQDQRIEKERRTQDILIAKEIILEPEATWYRSEKGGAVASLVNLRSMYPTYGEKQTFASILEAEKKEISFATPSEAMQLIVDKAKKLGVLIKEDNAKVYGVDSDLLNALQENLIEQDYFLKPYTPISFDACYDHYYLLFETYIGEVPIYSDGVSRRTEKTLDTAIVRAIVSSEGIELFEISGPVYEEMGIKEKNEEVLKEEEVQKRVWEYLEQDLSVVDLTKERLMLYYMPILNENNEILLVPMWYFVADVHLIVDFQTGEKRPFVLKLKIDAITGEISN